MLRTCICSTLLLRPTHLRFLDAFEKLQKATIGFETSVRLSVRMVKLGSHWTDFHEILYLRICRKSVEKFQVFIII